MLIFFTFSTRRNSVAGEPRIQLTFSTLRDHPRRPRGGTMRYFRAKVYFTLPYLTQIINWKITCDQVFLFLANLGGREKRRPDTFTSRVASHPLLLTCQQQCYIVSCFKCEPIRFYRNFMRPLGRKKQEKGVKKIGGT